MFMCGISSSKEFENHSMVVTKAAIHIFDGSFHEIYRYTGLNLRSVIVSRKEYMYAISDFVAEDAKSIKMTDAVVESNNDGYYNHVSPIK